jgi:hypothetical protein
MLFSTVRVLCVGFENEIIKNFNNETIDKNQYDYSVDNDEKKLFDIIEKHFSVKTPGNSFDDENKNLFNSFLKNVSIYENIFKQVFENIKPVEVLIKQKFDEFIDSLELPNNCLTSFARIIIAMKRSELWAFKCEFEKRELLEMITNQ